MAGMVVGVGYRDPNPPNRVINPFAAQFCEVEVNTRTGEIRILRFLAAHDSGRVLNRLTYDNQVFGGIVMGVGFAMTEDRVLDRQTGKMANANFHDYKVPTMLDVARGHECLPLDEPDNAFNTTGTKGLGEPATIPTAAAVAKVIDPRLRLISQSHGDIFRRSSFPDRSRTLRSAAGSLPGKIIT